MQVRCRRNWHGTVLLGFGMGGMVAGRDRETGQGTVLHDPSPGPLLSRHCIGGITYKDQSVVVAHEFLKSMSRPDRATEHDHLDTACKYDNAVDKAPGLIEGIHRKAGRYEPREHDEAQVLNACVRKSNVSCPPRHTSAVQCDNLIKETGKVVSGHAMSHILDSQLQTMHRWAKVNNVSSRPLPHQISGEAPPWPKPPQPPTAWIAI